MLQPKEETADCINFNKNEILSNVLERFSPEDALPTVVDILMKYPFPRNFTIPKRSWVEKLKTHYETFRIERRERRHCQHVEITLKTEERSLSDSDLPLIFITRNELAILPAFLKHYRKLGVTRFICVDDQSTDGTSDYLTRQSDVDVWVSPVRFRQARRGRRWRELLFSKYGLNRWYLNVDSDELLVYDRCGSKSLNDLIDTLEDAGISRLPAPMIDLYGSEVENSDSVEDLLQPWNISKYFDIDGYDVTLDKRGISVLGGPRKRLFDEQLQLMKFPLIYWDAKCRFGSSIHWPLPYERNFAPVWGALLHFKFYVNYREKIQEAADGKQHYNDAYQYQLMASVIRESGGIILKHSSSEVFTEPQQLIDLGFMSRISYSLDEIET